MSADKPRRLGRGLEALLTQRQPQGQESPEVDGSGLQTLPIAQIRANPYQPRREFRPEELAELQASLEASGLLQPISVRRRAGGYELIAGERRLRAATGLGWKEITAIVRDIDDRTMLTLALVENLQRADLNPLEEAEGYQRLIDEFSLTQQQVADAVGKDRSTVANFLRILALPDGVRMMLGQGLLTMGHARALLALSDERERVSLAQEVVAQQLSVRAVEQRVRELNDPPAESTGEPVRSTVGGPERTAAERSPVVRRIEDQLRRKLQTDVSVTLNADDRGTLRISFYSADDLERLLDVIIGADRTDFD